MRRLAVLTVIFTLALSGAAAASQWWFGGATQTAEMSSYTGPLGIDLAVNGAKGDAVTNVELTAFFTGAPGCYTHRITLHGLRFRIVRNSFKGTKRVVAGNVLQIAGKFHMSGVFRQSVTGTFTETWTPKGQSTACTTGRVPYTAEYESSPLFSADARLAQ